MRPFLFLCAALLASAALADDFSWLVPLNDLGTAPYRWGYYGGLYENGSNVMAADHFAGGLAMAAKIQPRATDGTPSADGKIAFVAIGFGETARIMDVMMNMAANDRRVDHEHLVLVNLARENADYRLWVPIPDGHAWYSQMNTYVLTPLGISPLQVQAAWVEIINDRAFAPLGVAYADAYRLKTFIAEALVEMKRQYPNLQIAYLSSRVYGGYSATTDFNPEPFSYETAYSNRWIITTQMEQERMEHPEWHWDSRVGLIDYRRGVAPWVAWGPYLWANGAQPRSDGVTWLPGDFEADGVSLSPSGAAKGGAALFDFLLREPTAKGWFSVVSGRQRSVQH